MRKLLRQIYHVSPVFLVSCGYYRDGCLPADKETSGRTCCQKNVVGGIRVAEVGSIRPENTL